MAPPSLVAVLPENVEADTVTAPLPLSPLSMAPPSLVAVLCEKHGGRHAENATAFVAVVDGGAVASGVAVEGGSRDDDCAATRVVNGAAVPGVVGILDGDAVDVDVHARCDGQHWPVTESWSGSRWFSHDCRQGWGRRRRAPALS